MLRDLKAPPRTRAASDSQPHLLAQGGLLDWRELEGLMADSLRAAPPSTSSSATAASRKTKASRRRHVKPQRTEAPPAHLQVLAAIALSCL
jgi:hypothetical protein